MSQTNMNCWSGSIALKTMFYRDTQALVIHTSRGTCARGDMVIHISFTLARNIPPRGVKQLIRIVAYLKSVVLELYESPTNLACRVTPFLCVPVSDVFVVEKQWKSLSPPEMTLRELWVLNAHNKNDKIDVFCWNVRQGVDSYRNIDHQKAEKLKKKQREKE